jgi:hypothetical protein
VGEEAEAAQPIVEGDHHHPLTGQGRAVVEGRRARAVDEAAAVDPHHHRRSRGGLQVRREDVEAEAVLAHGQGAHAIVGPVVALRADGAIAVPGPNPVPGRCRPGRPPAQITYGRSGIGDVLEGDDAARGHARHPARLGGRRRKGRIRPSRRPKRQAQDRRDNRHRPLHAVPPPISPPA